MSDTYRRYRAITTRLVQLYPRVYGHQRRHLATLALLSSGSVGAQHTQLPKITEHTPGGRAADERVGMRFRRLLKHAGVTYDRWMLPGARAVLALLARPPLVLVIDGSTVARGCMSLMVSVLYRGRALPIAWVVIKARKGHVSEALHCALLNQLIPLMPTDADVTILGDGELDGTVWQATIAAQGWQYVCRTASDILLTIHNTTIPLRALGVPRGDAVGVERATITAARYGPVNVLAVWEAAYDAPLYVVTNHSDRDRALQLYRRRAQIETFFSDQKSRGFRLDRSHLHDPQRVARLLIATTLAYLWVIYLGVLARRAGDRKRFVRTDRADLSLFSLGLRFVAYCLRHRRPLPSGVPMPRRVA